MLLQRSLKQGHASNQSLMFIENLAGECSWSGAALGVHKGAGCASQGLDWHKQHNHRGSKHSGSVSTSSSIERKCPLAIRRRKSW